ncbi:MAG: PAS domain S-box protein, partial [Angelakisella sp.]
MEKKNKKKLLGGLLFLTLYLLLLVLAAQIAPEAVLLLLGVSALFTVVEVHTLHQNKIKRTILQQERDRLRQILNHIPLPLFLVTEQHCLNFVNTIALELFHCKGDVVGQPCHCLNTSICHTAECAIEKMEQTGNGRTYYDMDGKSYMVSTASLEKETDNNGKYIEIIQDITEVVEAQRSLEEKTLELETMSENLIGGVLITTMDEGFPVIRCNQSYRDMVQKPDEQILGQGAMQWVAAEDALKLTQKIRQQLAQGNSVNLEYHLHCQNNVVIWVSLRGKRAVLRGAEVGVWFLTDISSRKEAELALKIEEERYRIAMQSVEDIIIDYDMKTHIMYHSSKAKEIYGVPEIMKNMPQSILDSGTVLAESRKEYLDLFQQLAAGTAKCSCILRTRAADGRSLWNRLTFTAIFDNEGNTVRAIGILQDITKEKSVELQYKREARYLDLEGKEGTFYYEADMTHHCFISGHEPIVNSYCDQPIDDFDTVVELLTTHMVYEPDRDFVRRQTSWAAIMSGYDAGILRKSVEYRRSINGELTWASCSMQTFFDEETQSLHCVGCIRNINEMKEKEISLQQRAERDLLTGLYNKVTTEMLIQSAVG